ncbi:hypothetical protein XPA_009890 [Xanthoria parietina]
MLGDLLKKGYLRQAHRHHDGTCLYNNHYNRPKPQRLPAQVVLFRFYQYNYLFYYHLRSPITANTVTSSSIDYLNPKSLVSTTTIYVACATNNVLSPCLKNDNEFAGSDTRDPAVQTSRKQANTPYDCCVACISSPSNCQFSFYDPDNEFCFKFENVATCPTQPFIAGPFSGILDDDRTGIFYSNDPCGQLQSGGLTIQSK